VFLLGLKPVELKPVELKPVELKPVEMEHQEASCTHVSPDPAGTAPRKPLTTEKK
jgi:hypothetical protein